MTYVYVLMVKWWAILKDLVCRIFTSRDNDKANKSSFQLSKFPFLEAPVGLVSKSFTSRDNNKAKNSPFVRFLNSSVVIASRDTITINRNRSKK